MAVTVVPDAACLVRCPQCMYGTRRNPRKIPGQTTGDVARDFNLELTFSHDNELVGVVNKTCPDLSRRISEDAEGEFWVISPYRVTRDGNGIRTVPKEIVHPRFPSERQSQGPPAALTPSRPRRDHDSSHLDPSRCKGGDADTPFAPSALTARLGKSPQPCPHGHTLTFPQGLMQRVSRRSQASQLVSINVTFALRGGRGSNAGDSSASPKGEHPC